MIVLKWVIVCDFFFIRNDNAHKIYVVIMILAERIKILLKLLPKSMEMGEHWLYANLKKIFANLEEAACAIVCPLGS